MSARQLRAQTPEYMRLKLQNTHSSTACAGQHCVAHNPSHHGMRNWKLNWRNDKGQMERICPEHGVGHPDPDDLAWHEANGREWMVEHGCCGCCGHD